MKRFVFIPLLLCMVLVFGAVVSSIQSVASPISYITNKVRLSSLSPEECMAFLADSGVELPERFRQEVSENDPAFRVAIKELIGAFEENPDLSLGMSHEIAFTYFEDIRKVVMDYYDLSRSLPILKAPYVLQDSIQWGQWNTSMQNYNCYAHALGKTTYCSPGSFSGQSYNGNASVQSFADLVKDDLQGQLGYACVKVQTTRPSSTSGWLNVLAVRKDSNKDAYNMNDYHVAKIQGGNWLHKPGATAVLRFHSAPANGVVWSNERYDGTTYLAPFIWYESNIIYLLYKLDHTSGSSAFTGQHYHSGSRHYYQYTSPCTRCGEIATFWQSSLCPGPPCSIPWSP